MGGFDSLFGMAFGPLGMLIYLGLGLGFALLVIRSERKRYHD